MAFNFRKRSEHLIDGPSCVQATAERCPIYAEAAGPVRQAERKAAECKQVNASPIAALLFARSPAAILWGVAFLIIYAVNGAAFGFQAHVRDERLVAVAPSITNGDPATAIVYELAAFCVMASVKHANPRIVRGSVESFVLSVQFVFEAAAGHGELRNEGLSHYGAFGAAFASAPEAASAVPILVRELKYGPTTEFLTNQI